VWARLNPATEKALGAWMLWFQRRYKQYKSWVEHGEPKVMWLSGLHIPETYLAALVQVRISLYCLLTFLILSIETVMLLL
jgi:dynein heavy chain